MRKLITAIAWIVCGALGVMIIVAFYFLTILSHGWIWAWLAAVGIGAWAILHLFNKYDETES